MGAYSRAMILLLDEIFRSGELGSEWSAVAPSIESALAADVASGSINRGDGRAIYYLVRALKPARLLEIGTHVGGSTLHIAAAMRRNIADGRECSLTTVDLKDVDGAGSAPWKRAGLSQSPRDNIASLGMADRVEFVTGDSSAYFRECSTRFDFIFVDGNHREDSAYADILAATGCLQPGGSILLHDFFPNQAPLWSNGKVISGPFLAVERLRSEGRNLSAIPLGALPWPTKIGSHVTSLAILFG
jgi:predicted O-methyltransferase YrrM